MPEKNSKPNNSAKDAKDTPKSAAKPVAKSTAKPVAKPTSKPAPTAKAASNKSADTKPAASAKQSTAAKPVAKSSVTAKTGTATQRNTKSSAKKNEVVDKEVQSSAKKADTALEKTTKTATASNQAETGKKTESAKPVAKSQVKAKQNKTAEIEDIDASELAAAAAIPAAPVRGEMKNAEPKKNKAEKPAKSQAAKTTKAKSKVNEQSKKKNKLVCIIAISVAAVVLILTLTLGLVYGLRAKNAPAPLYIDEYARYDVFSHKTTTAVGFSGQTVGTVQRYKPVAEVKDEGLESGYPKYGHSLNNVLGNEPEKLAARDALINESDYMCALGTRNNSGNGNNGDGTYVWMDKDGWLYSGTVHDEPLKHAVNPDGSNRQLYKHTAAAGMYYGGLNNTSDLSDDEPAIIKKVSLTPRGYGSYSVTGVYAPAGEVIKIEISEEDMEATGGLTIHIGQALYNGQSNNIWTAKGQMQRFPNILNTMNVNKNTATLKDGVYTAYVGSFVGGPLYIRNTVAPFTATISGGVAYSHFILGYTTQKEFEENAKSTAPYFDLEVRNYGVLHSGPKLFAQNFSYEDIYKAAVLWEKVSSVTTTGSSQGIVFLYDAFVAAGAAVAFPGRSSVNCPASWMSGSLNYNAIVTSGSWGNFHEYHHNFQGYGVGNGGEVTNNGMTLVSYALFTKISEKRGMLSYGAQGLGGWNSYTSATWALNEVLKIAKPNESPSNGDMGLTLYATLLHNFGADNYIQAKVQQQSNRYGQSYLGYLKAWQDITHNDMTYYFKDILCGITEDVARQWTNPSYSMFVPVSSVYQTGRSYMYDGEKRYINTMQPFVIPYGDEFTVDLRKYDAPNGMYAQGSIVLPDGFKFEIKNITQPENGRLVPTEEKGVYKYIPDTSKKELRSGKIIVTLGITATNNKYNFAVDDIDLVLEFKQSHESTKWQIKRTTYEFSPENMYADAAEAFENGYKNYSSKTEGINENPVQNCNTDIWYYPNTDQYADSPFVYKTNRIAELSGKLYFEEEGTYRIYLRGRNNCALYYSTEENGSYTLGAWIKDASTPKNSHLFRNDENTYFDYVVKNAHSWLYIKEVLICSPNVTAYIGVGMSKWTEPMFTIQEVKDANGNVIGTKYYNYLGVEVSEEEANRAELIPPVITSRNQPYVNAYKNSYESVADDFESEYLYTRKYKYDYTDNRHANANQTVVSCKYSQGNANWGGSGKGTGIENIADGDKNTWIHTSGSVSVANPFEVVIDMGEAKAANRMTLFSQYRPNGDWKVAKNFTLYGSMDGETFFLVGDFVDVPRNGSTVVVDFEEKTFRYFKLVVTASEDNKHLIISEIELMRVFEIFGGEQLSPDKETFKYYGNWGGAQATSTFGHVYVGSRNSSVSFEFEGTRLGITSSLSYGRSFEVYIDGNNVGSIGLKEQKNVQNPLVYLSQELTEGKHSVTVKCTGEANIDSIVIF